MIDEHINTLTEKAKGIERRLCETSEKLEADKIVVLCEQLSKYIGAMNYLQNIKAVREGEKKVKPAQLVKLT
jgi:hypothetical protein